MSYSPLESAQLVPGKMYKVVSANSVTRNGTLKQGKNGGEPLEFVRISNSGAELRARGMVPMTNRPANAVFKVQDEMTGEAEEYKVTMYPGSKYVKNASSGGGRRKTRKGKRSARKTMRRRR